PYIWRALRDLIPEIWRVSRWTIVNKNLMMTWIVDFNNVNLLWMRIIAMNLALILGHYNANNDYKDNTANCSPSSSNVNSA
ncbi:MAG: hypothetical protein ACKO96_33670, partial [Flammeovirgaceae bacterium]